ncbi:MAG TPA: site-specific DNA-methyltransferase [Smithellaceae bacterium]|nr:site-specific DNA-methyltransferase [Smithellaceae bacterium]
MKMPKQYNITPAKGQALLNFQGRRFPDKVDLFEAEVIEEVRNTKAKQQSLLDKETDLNSDFRNLLIQGDCLSSCAYLKSKNIKIDLVYIDPPFASGANYAKKIYLRNSGESKIKADDNTIGEEIMYGDIWQKEDYLNWLYERLLAIKDIMNETASIYVHLDWHIGHYAKILMDEIFGEEYFQNEIIWYYTNKIPDTRKHQFQSSYDFILFYTNSDDYPFEHQEEKRDKPIKVSRMKKIDGKKVYVKGDDGKGIYDVRDVRVVDNVWTIPLLHAQPEIVDYLTQKPEELLQRIISASSENGMVVADFFSGSGTTAKVAHDLKRKFIACDIGINAIQTARDRLVEAGADFDILKIQDGLRLFRNPAQTTAKIFSIIDGFKSRADLNLSDFWDGGIAQGKSLYTPVKFSGIHDKLTKELLDVYLEEIYKLEDATSKASEVIIIYSYKDFDIDQEYLNKQLKKAAKTELKVKLVSLDDLLAEKRDALFTPDNADIKITKQGDKYKIEIKKYYSPYLKNKIDEYNAKRVKKDSGKAVKISSNGLELIEAVQFDTTLGKAWKSRLDLEDKAGIKDKIKGVYTLDTDKFRIKIRNIAGDEITIDSEEI